MQVAIEEGEQTADTKRYTPILLHMLARESRIYKRIPVRGRYTIRKANVGA